jgi:hypothetical protein
MWIWWNPAIGPFPPFVDPLKLMLQSLSISDVVAFTATELQPCLTVGFIINYAQQVLVEGFPLGTCFQRLLPTASAICRHTDIVHIQRTHEGINGYRYIWVHPEIRPWGHMLPVQCSKCGCIRPWMSAAGTDGARLFTCQNPRCTNKLTFCALKEKSWLGGDVFGGRWLVMENRQLLGVDMQM